MSELANLIIEKIEALEFKDPTNQNRVYKIKNISLEIGDE